jgi:hypothetical protein
VSKLRREKGAKYSKRMRESTRNPGTIAQSCRRCQKVAGTTEVQCRAAEQERQGYKSAPRKGGDTEDIDDVYNLRPVARATGGGREHGDRISGDVQGAGGITVPTAVRADGQKTWEAIHDKRRAAWGADG